MNGIWLPGLVALVVGLAAGGLLAWRLKRRGVRPAPAAGGSGRKAAAEPAADAAAERLLLRDLEERRDDLYRRLREEELEPDERAALEEAAARVLRDLDRAGGGQAAKPEAPARAPVATPAATPVVAPAGGGTAEAAGPRRRGGRYQQLVGFAAGAATVALIGLLVTWAERDARPREERAPAPPRAATGDEPPHDGAGQLSPEAAARVAELEARLAAAPEDLMARKELALIELASGRFFEAFRQAEEVVRRQPEDPDGLYVQGVVRLAMGQTGPAIELLDRVLARYPEHLQALLYRGMALFQQGDVAGAQDTWEVGLELAGGSHPDLERLIAMARETPPPVAPPATAEAAPAGPVAGAPVPGAPVPGGPVPGAQASGAPAGEAPRQTPTPAAAADPAAYQVRVELAAGAQAPPGAALFLFLRPAGGGPPIAVKRLPATGFPLDAALGAEDSMMGAELPGSGLLVARLDADGSASTRGEGDLEATAEATRGSSSRLVLGR